ncbi:MAG: hypothetical protein CMH27_02875 [Micavibrio sp.]|nr:hypothetical protein [Micavibrio sp.]
MPKTHSDAAARFVNGACYDLFSEEEHKVKRAKCILRLDELFKAKNNVAAQVILGNSKCNEIKAPKETRIRKTHPVDPITDFMLSIDRDKADETVDLSKDTF